MNPNFFEMIKNMQSQMGDMQGKLSSVRVTGESGGGLVKIELNGKMEVESVRLDPVCVDPRDIGMLEDLIKSACISASMKMRDKLASEFSSISGDFSPDILRNLKP